MLLRKIIRGLLVTIVVILLVAIALVGRIDRTPLLEQDFYNDMMAKLDTVKFATHDADTLQVMWNKVNITPQAPHPMAGYMPRDHFDAVHDSLYARMLMIKSGNFYAVMINVDLLIFPPLLRDRLKEKMTSMGHGNIFLYLSATHTHSGAGGWDSSLGGRLITGSYDEEWLEKVADDIANAVERKRFDGKFLEWKDATIQYWEAEAVDLVENRVDVDSGKVDGKLRGIKLHCADGSNVVLFTHSAHATSIQKDILELSGDYPNAVISSLEKKNDFAMFMSGMVGSHRFKYTPESSYEFIDNIAPVLAARIDSGKYDQPISQPRIRSVNIPIEFGPSQLRIGRDWKVRDWVFQSLFRKLKGDLTYLEFENVIFIGTPCDFSGEIYAIDSLEQFAAERGKKLIITSFNGDYDGYVTYDGHYEASAKEEINALNWVGPYYGEYFSTMIKKLVSK